MITLEGKVGETILIEGKPYHYFAGNNYLGLACNTNLTQAAMQALEHYGNNFSASRKTTGTAGIHLELEAKLAAFKDQEQSMVFASGYMGNKILLDYLCRDIDVVLTDSMAHASILDGIPRSVSTVKSFAHLNADDLEQKLAEYKNERVLIATDGIFALTGEIAPLDKIHALAEKYNALILVDDAHATGVLGENGRGTAERFGLSGSSRIFQPETMSKALGSYGGFIAGPAALICKLRESSAFYGASTSLPPALVASGCAALDYLNEHPGLHKTVIEKAIFVKTELEKLGFSTIQYPTPIVPLFFESEKEAEHFSTFLFENQIIAPAVKYPVKTSQSLVRMTLSAAHTPDQLEYLIQTIKTWKSKHGSNQN